MQVSITYSFFVVLCFAFVKFYSTTKTADVCTVPETPDEECLNEFFSFFCHCVIKFDDSKIHSHLGCLRQGMKVDKSYKCDENPINIPELSSCDNNPKQESFDLPLPDNYMSNVFAGKDIDEEDCIDELRVFNHNAENESNENYVKMFNKYVPVAFDDFILKRSIFRRLCIEQLYNLTKKNMNA